MKGVHRLAAKLARDASGAAVIEFAILAPALCGMLLGVLQIGLSMQSYNAIRNITADTARFAIVEFQKGEEPTNEDIRAKALSIAKDAPYLLEDMTLADITVGNAATQRVNGAREITIKVTYEAETILPFFEWVSPTTSHERPIFVLEP